MGKSETGSVNPSSAQSERSRDWKDELDAEDEEDDRFSGDEYSASGDEDGAEEKSIFDGDLFSDNSDAEGAAPRAGPRAVVSGADGRAEYSSGCREQGIIEVGWSQASVV